jgi:murein DD-endopeptidase MepM/ murein hydrolase activator NlpD
MKLKEILRFLPLIVLVLPLVACEQSRLEMADPASQAIEASLPARTAPPANQSSNPEDTQGQAVALDLPLTATLPVENTQPSPTPTKTPTPIPFRICSPLDIHDLEELPEIISDPYRPPPPGKEERHHGVDFSYYRRGERTTIQGVGVQSVFSGKVVAAIVDSFPYGNVVILETEYADLPAALAAELEIPPGESIYTLYAHMDQAPLVALGDPVLACQALGQVGMSGNAYEPHLHLEMRLGAPGAQFTSMGFYKADDTAEERSNYLRWRTSGEFRHFDPMRVLKKTSDDPMGGN